MMLPTWIRSLRLAAVTAAFVVAVGCSQPAGTEAPKEKAKNDKDKPKEKEEPKHDGWWCDEHGVPEDECSMCSRKILKEAKDKGELCPKHPDRSKDQCFICNPDLWDKSAARYKAKENKDAP